LVIVSVFVVDHASFEEPPESMVEGVAVSVQVGGGIGQLGAT
jgi:hypothetical protein